MPFTCQQSRASSGTAAFVADGLHDGGVMLLAQVEIRRFQLHLAEAGVSICNRNRIMTGLRFLFRVTLRRLDLANEVYHIRESQKIPLVMSSDETRRLLAVASNLEVRTLLSLGYGCGLRASEMVRTDDAVRSSLATCPRPSRSIQARRPARSSSRWFSRRCRGGFRKRPDATAANRPICLLQRAAGP